jgi:prophage regulatory protein
MPQYHSPTLLTKGTPFDRRDALKVLIRARRETYPRVRRLVGATELRHRVVYTPPGISKLEKAGLFPRRLRIGPKKICWYLDEVVQWMQEKVDARSENDAYIKRIKLNAKDRFLSKRETSRYVLISITRIYGFEAAGLFPGRIKIGPKRVAYLERELAQWLEDRRAPVLGGET